MANTAKRFKLSNRELGELVGLNHTTISRIRASTRWPSVPAMQRIEKVLSWPVAEQISCRANTSREVTKYAKELERRVRRYLATRAELQQQAAS